jgi:hypothetical protein
MCWPTPICAMITCSMRCCRPKSRSRRLPKCRWRWPRRPKWSAAMPARPQKADAHRHRRHHRRSQLGAALYPVRRAASLSRAVGIDMESATIAAQGYRFRVPYGTLLCVSDKPLHGEIKLPGQANRFYEEAIAAHLKIGTTACDLLRRKARAAQPQAARLQRAAVPVTATTGSHRASFRCIHKTEARLASRQYRC